MPDIPPEVLGLIIPYLRRPVTPKKTASGTLDYGAKPYHQQDLTSMMRVSRTAAQLTANHLYTEVVIDDYPFLTIGIEKPCNNPTSASSIVTDLDPHAINQNPIAHKQDLLRKITTAHFVYSSEAKKLLRTLSDRESAGLDASDVFARLANLPISTRYAVMRNMDLVVDDESLSCFTPSVVNVTFSSWDHRPLQPCPILVNFNMAGTVLLAQSMAHRFVHPPPVRGSTSVESLFGGQYTKLSATYRCRSRCEGLPSIRLQQSYGANPTETNVVHHWNLMYPPYLVFGAQNDIIISIFEREAPRDTITAHVICLLSIVNSDTWCQATHHQGEGDSPSMDTTRITLHIRQHHMNGKHDPHTADKAAAFIEVLDDSISEVISNGRACNAGWVHRLKIVVADPKASCKACGVLYDGPTQ